MIALKDRSVLLEEALTEKGMSRFVGREFGDMFVTIGGVNKKQELFVNS